MTNESRPPARKSGPVDYTQTNRNGGPGHNPADAPGLFVVEAFTDASSGRRVVRFHDEPELDHRRGPAPADRETPSRFTALEHADPAQVQMVDRWIDRRAAGRQRFNADDARAELDLTPQTIAALGGIFSRARRSGRIIEAGTGPSRNPSRRGALCRYWVGRT